MKEREQIVELWQREQASVLLTLVMRRGSAYRRPGAHLLVSARGEYAGSISGGCLEAELLSRASWFVRNGAVLRMYSSFFDDHNEMPYGLGCGGEVEVLLEPSETAEAQAWCAAAQQSLRGPALRVYTLLPENGKSLLRMVVSGEDEIRFVSDGLPLSVQEELLSLSAEGLAELADGQRVFVEELKPPSRLILFGAWEDARPLCSFAANLGWRVEVADGRKPYLDKRRFPEADRLHVLNQTDSLADLELQAEDSVVLMTHSFQQDLGLLVALAAYPLRYIGLLGAHSRTATLLSLASKRLGSNYQAVASRIFAPAGLAIGAEGPHAIALSILAQVEAAKNGYAHPGTLMEESEDFKPQC